MFFSPTLPLSPVISLWNACRPLPFPLWNANSLFSFPYKTVIDDGESSSATSSSCCKTSILTLLYFLKVNVSFLELLSTHCSFDCWIIFEWYIDIVFGHFVKQFCSSWMNDFDLTFVNLIVVCVDCWILFCKFCEAISKEFVVKQFCVPVLKVHVTLPCCICKFEDIILCVVMCVLIANLEKLMNKRSVPCVVYLCVVVFLFWKCMLIPN
jgi:hypothetical protein